MWKFTAKNEYDTITLHDCRATHMWVDGRDLVVDFLDGIWLVEDNRQNPYGKTLRTDAAQVRFLDCKIDSLYVYKEFRFFGRIVWTKQIELEPNELIEKTNSGEWKLEFLYEYRGCGGYRFDCWIWHQKGHPQECQLTLQCTDMECYWNRLRQDRVW